MLLSKVPSIVPTAQSHHHHHYQASCKNPKSTKEYLCKYPKIIFKERYTSQSYKILKTLSPALFLEEGKGRRENIHLNLMGSLIGSNSSNNLRPLRLLSDHKGMLKLPCLEIQEFNFSLEQEHPFLLG